MCENTAECKQLQRIMWVLEHQTKFTPRSGELTKLHGRLVCQKMSLGATMSQAIKVLHQIHGGGIKC